MRPIRRVVASSILAGAGIAFAALALAADAPSPVTAGKKPVVRVYYFHTTQRCASCKKVEALSESAVREAFGRELAAGTVEWQLVNTDDRANQHYLEDYQLYTKSLVVVELVDGRQARWKNLPRIWELLRDETEFRRYVQGEVREYVEKRS